jgi:hypothetical protein
MIEQTMQELTTAVRELIAVMQGARVAVPPPPPVELIEVSKPASPPAPATKPAPASKPPTRQEVTEAFLELGKQKGQQAMVDALNAYRVPKLGQLPESQYAPFLAHVKAQLGVH